MAEKSILIIGGGIAGLSAGCYGQMNGFRTRIFELHKKPGGLCTSWKRQEYVIDGCLHWLIGTGKGTGLRQMWDELGALEGREIVDNDVFLYTEDASGNRFSFPTNIDALERALLAFSPDDRQLIDQFVAACRKLLTFDMPLGKAPELQNLGDKVGFLIRFFPLLKTFGRWNRVSIGEFADRFKHPLLRLVFRDLFLPEFPLIFAIMTIAWLHRKDAGYPIGGSLAFSRGIEKRYLELGGEAIYKARVAKILVENNRAVGVRLEDGTEHRADYVISAADGHATIFDMLDGNYLDAEIRKHYEQLPVFPSLVHMAFGVNRTFDDLPACVSGVMLPLDPAIAVGRTHHDRLWLQIYNFDRTLAPAGKTVVRAMLIGDYGYWKTLKETPDRYTAEKERIAREVIDRLEKRFPGFAGQVEMKDLATPVTFERYTANWQGSIEGWVPIPRIGGMRFEMKKTLPGLDRFYLAGQWVEPGGGVPIVALSGRNAIQLICRDEKRKFRTAQP